MEGKQAVDIRWKCVEVMLRVWTSYMSLVAPCYFNGVELRPLISSPGEARLAEEEGKNIDAMNTDTFTTFVTFDGPCCDCVRWFSEIRVAWA